MRIVSMTPAKGLVVFTDSAGEKLVEAPLIGWGVTEAGRIEPLILMRVGHPVPASDMMARIPDAENYQIRLLT